MHLTRAFRPGDLVWFDPGVGYVLPGEVVEFHRAAQVITVQAVISNVTKTFTLNNLSSVKSRQDLGQNGVEDMVSLTDLNEASVLWNLRIRYDNQNIYSYIGTILVAVNPFRMFDTYGLDKVNQYDGQIIGKILKLGSVAGPVIQATGRSEFEDGLGSGDFVSGYSYHMSVRTRLSDHTKQTKFQSQRHNNVETPVPSISSTEVQQHRDSQYLDG
jgi:hypothetical protein